MPRDQLQVHHLDIVTPADVLVRAGVEGAADGFVPPVLRAQQIAAERGPAAAVLADAQLIPLAVGLAGRTNALVRVVVVVVAVPAGAHLLG